MTLRPAPRGIPAKTAEVIERWAADRPAACHNFRLCVRFEDGAEGEVDLSDVAPDRMYDEDTALGFGRFTDTEPRFWLNLQQPVDLWDALHSQEREEIESIETIQSAAL